MKTFGFLLLSIVLIGFASSAAAKPDKNDIMHCGCVYVADEGSETTGTASMEWKQLSVKNGKGHRNHLMFHEDDCLSGYEPIFCTEDDVINLVEGCLTTDDIKGYDPQYTTFVRGFDDCLVAGNPNLLGLCDNLSTGDVDETPLEGDDCSLVD